MSHSLPVLTGAGDRVGGTLDCLAGVLDREQLPRQPGLCGNFVSQKIAAWRVVLMQTMDANAIDRSSAGRCHGFSPGIMSCISDAHPVDSHEHDR
jgi:hypothetical protein